MTKVSKKYGLFQTILLGHLIVFLLLIFIHVPAYSELHQYAQRAHQSDTTSEMTTSARPSLPDAASMAGNNSIKSTNLSNSRHAYVSFAKRHINIYTIFASGKTDTLSEHIETSKFILPSDGLTSKVNQDSSIHTQIFPNDSLLLSVRFENELQKNTALAWYINDSLIDVTGLNTALVYWADGSDMLKIDTIRVIPVSKPKASTSLTRSWIIESNTIGRTIGQLIEPDQQLLFMYPSDTIHFSIDRYKFDEPDSLTFRWFVNSIFMGTQFSEHYSFSSNHDENSADTISVLVNNANNDSLLFDFTWYVDFLVQTEPEQMFQTEPINENLFLFEGDSVEFNVNFFSDTLKIAWYKNNELQTYDGSRFVYHTSTKNTIADTIRVQIRNGEDELLDEDTWIVNMIDELVPSRLKNSEYLNEIITFQPSQDTIYYVPGDSLILSINSLPSHLSCLWKHSNSFSVFENQNQFVYLPPESEITSIIDSVSVMVINVESDTLFRHEWYIHIDAPVEQSSDSLKFSFSPKNNTIVTVSDSMRFHVDAAYSFTFRWFLNSDELENAYPFFLIRSSEIDSLDTVKVILSMPGSTLIDSIQWVVRAENVEELVRRLYFTPESDTVRTRAGNDSLQFWVSGALESDQITWIVSGDTLHDMMDSVLVMVIPEKTNEPTYGIKIDIRDDQGLLVDSKEWILIHDQTMTLSTPLSFYPSQDTIFVIDDSLYFGVEGVTSDAEIFWIVNNELVSDYSSSVFTADSIMSGLDSAIIMVKVTTNRVDTLAKRWVLITRSEPIILPQFYFYPQGDTSVTVGDTLRLMVMSDLDSLFYKWYVNGSLVQMDTIPELEFSSAESDEDTVQLAVIEADSSVLIEHSWIVSSVGQDSTDLLIPYAMMADTLTFAGDTLLLSISNDPSALLYVWFLNQNYLYSDSIAYYSYFPSDLLRSYDTVRVDTKNSDHEIIYSHVWYIRLVSPINVDSFDVAFIPDGDTTFYYGDSITFRVVADTSIADFQWYVNDELIHGYNDSVFSYYVSPMNKSKFQVLVKWAVDDSLYSRLWSYTLLYHDSLKSLPDIKLLYPRDNDVMTEDDEFIWTFDSLGFITRDDQLFYIQISGDSMFSEIICMDTCRHDTMISFHEFKGNEKLRYAETYFWRIVVADTTRRISSNMGINTAFRLSSQYVDLIYYSAEYSIDGNIVINWTIDNADNLAGFNLHRSETNNSDYKQLNEFPITGSGSFQYIDIQFDPGKTYYYKLEELCTNGKRKFHTEISIESPQPQNYALFSNYPNPFNMRTIFRFQIPDASHVTISVYNILGRKIKTIVDERKESGLYSAVWDGFDDEGAPVVSGLYFYQMVAGDFRQTRKLTVVR